MNQIFQLQFPSIPGLCLFVIPFIFTSCVCIDKQHQKACDQVAKLAKAVDNILADPHEDEQYHGSRVVFSSGFIADTSGKSQYSNHGSVRLELPGFKDKWGAIFAGDSQRETTHFDDDSGPVLEETDRNYESFFRFFNRDDSWVNWDFDVGVKYNKKLKYFTRIKANHSGSIGCSQYDFTQKFIWRNKDGFGTSHRIEFDQPLTSQVYVRELLDLTYSEKSHGIDILQGIYLRAKASEKLAWSLEMTQFAITDPWDYDYLEFALRIRKVIGWKWMTLEIVPRARYYREDHLWNLIPKIEAFLHLTFDSSRLTH